MAKHLFGPGNPGRPKGTPNKLTRTTKENVAECFERIGGLDSFALWAAANPKEFYAIWAKLIPTEVSGPEGTGLVVQIVRLGEGDKVLPQ